MARITVEDCLDKVNTRYELILLAAKRARQLATGEDEEHQKLARKKHGANDYKSNIPEW